ncbi:UPF0058 family protein [Haladaptatus salinisoli]|uniref:UPF0058 family protein n=1 Tax=Haladaptatus salinisoli TaxID=2884876 RepID=UPI001D0B2E30|nr:UPF0058 family protein [Haladaptatus salinisoli]
MKKQELIHLHGLLSEVRNKLNQKNSSPIDIPAYETQDTRPTSIHHSKEDHRKAVLTLCDGITTNLMEEKTEFIVSHAD